MHVIILICHTPIVNRGQNVILSPFLTSWQWKTLKWRWFAWLLILEQRLIWWQCPVASSKALDPRNRAMHTVTYRLIAMASKVTSKVVIFFHGSLFACRLSPWRPPGMRSKKSPVGGFQGHLVWPWICCIGRCHVHHFYAFAWPLK